MSKAGKVWGNTELVEANGVLEFHRLETKAGGTCSKHLHEFKWNGFFVETGEMIIRVWQKDYDLVDETTLKAGDFCKVKPGLYHQFESVTDCVAYELYWAEFSHNDIKRQSVGHASPNVVQLNEQVGGSIGAAMAANTVPSNDGFHWNPAG